MKPDTSGRQSMGYKLNGRKTPIGLASSDVHLAISVKEVQPIESTERATRNLTTKSKERIRCH
jgi:hypothetical protein